MQFKVPQFLDIEDKIFGPFTFRQFIYLAGGAGTCFVFYRLLGFFWGLVPMLIVAGFVAALAFYKPNNKPFINMVESAFKYFFQDKLYVWRKRTNTDAESKAISQRQAASMASVSGNTVSPGEIRLSGNKLRDLAWSLDVLDLNKGEKSDRSPQVR